MFSKIVDMCWMYHALDLAKQAKLYGEVPVGAVIIYGNKVLGEGWNRSIISHDPTAHAELTALRAACAKEGNYRLPGATLYVTLEPCLMCAGALVHARIKRVVFATTAKSKIESVGSSIFDVLNDDRSNHHILHDSGILAKQSQHLLRQFFRIRR